MRQTATKCETLYTFSRMVRTTVTVYRLKKWCMSRHRLCSRLVQTSSPAQLISKTRLTAGAPRSNSKPHQPLPSCPLTRCEIHQLPQWLSHMASSKVLVVCLAVAQTLGKASRSTSRLARRRRMKKPRYSSASLSTKVYHRVAQVASSEARVL